MTVENNLPRAFIERRLHSLTGLFLVLFLIEHLFLNSQAALFFGEDGSKFVKSVNSIHDLPYLPLIEILLLGVPIVLHAWWGIIYLRTGKQNAYGNPGNVPYLPEYPRNKAYTWQRITSWILLFGIAAHVIHMRFIEYPTSAQQGSHTYYMFPLAKDSGLETLAARLGFKYYDAQQIATQKNDFAQKTSPQEAVGAQQHTQEQKWVAALEHRPIKSGEVMVVTDSFGMAELLLVRETFKMPLMLALYTIFVLAACFHAFNGLWTFLITWGVTLTQTSQRMMLWVARGLMVIISFMGLSAIWLTYWFNLKY